MIAAAALTSTTGSQSGRLRNSHRHVVLLPPELECPPAPTGSRLAPAHEGCHIIDQGDIWLDVDRTTASVSYHHPGSEGREWSLTAAWGTRARTTRRRS